MKQPAHGEVSQPDGVSVDGDPAVSVVIPTRDRWDRLARTLRSALHQVGVAVEVIVVDDGSRTPFPSSLEHPRVRTVRHARSRGVAAARNTGIREARGLWIAFLDDDDLWAPHKLAEQLSVARATDADFAFCSALAVTGEGSVIEHMLAPSTTQLARELGRRPLPAGSSTVVARRTLIERAEGFDEGLSHFADWDLWLRFSLLGVGASLSEPLVAYVQHSQNMVLYDTSALRAEFDVFAAKHAARRDGVTVSQTDMTRWIAKSHLRSGLRIRAAREYAAAAMTERSPSDALRAVTAPFGPRAMEAASMLANAGRRLLRSADAPWAVRASAPDWLAEALR